MTVFMIRGGGFLVVVFVLCGFVFLGRVDWIRVEDILLGWVRVFFFGD